MIQAKNLISTNITTIPANKIEFQEKKAYQERCFDEEGGATGGDREGGAIGGDGDSEIVGGGRKLGEEVKGRRGCRSREV